MPIVSRFYGIVVRMYFGDHNPPHFHAAYGSDEVMIGIESADAIAGRLPNRAAALAAEWARLRRAELRDNWDRMQDGQAPLPIPPLDQNELVPPRSRKQPCCPVSPTPSRRAVTASA